MPSVDDRIVRLEFENAQFEKGVGTSMKSLDRLDSKIKSNVSGTALLALGSAADKVGQRFSALEIAGITAISNIVNKAVDSGERMLRSLTVDQLIKGWDKYADKTSAVQTIMAATAKDFSNTEEQMEYVNGQLNKLNWFTDETSYSFLDMVNSIGKFTSNNIALDQSVTAMQGISTWAAISGANVNEASRAMYNLSQAISVGAVKLMDWKSIENANMATYEFKEMAIDTALALGTVVKNADGMYHAVGKVNNVFNASTGFNQTLSDGWFTSEVLLKTLDRYGSATNKLYEISEKTGYIASDILEYVDEFKEGSLDLGKISKETGISVQELTEDFKTLTSESYDLGIRAFRAAQEAKTFKEAIEATYDAVSTGWMTTYEWLFGNYQEARKLWTKVANELYDVFAEPGNRRNAILQIWHEGIDGASGYQIALEAIGNLWNTLKTIAGNVKSAFHNIFPQLSEEDAGARLIKWTEAFRDWTEKVYDFFGELIEPAEEASEVITNLFSSSLMPSGWALGQPITEAAANVDTLKEKVHELAMEVIQGLWNNGSERFDLLRAAGWDPYLIQNEVNRQFSWSNFRYEETEEMWQKMAETMGVSWESVSKRVGRASYSIEAAQDNLGKKAEENAKSLGLLNSNFADTYGRILKPIVEMTEEEKVLLNQINLYDSLRGIFSIVEMIKNALSAFKIVFIDPVLSKIPDLITTILDKTGALGRKIVDVSSKLKQEEYFLNLFKDAKDWIKAAADNISLFFETLGSHIVRLKSYHEMMERFEQIGSWFNSLKLTVVERFSQLMARLNAEAERLGVTLPEFFGMGLFDIVLKGVDKLFDGINKLLDLISPSMDWIIAKVTAFFDWFDSLEDLSLGSIIGSAIDEIVKALGPTSAIGSIISDLGTTIDSVIQKGKTAYGLVGEIAQNGTNAVSGAKEVVSEVNGLIDSVSEAAGSKANITDTIDNVSNGLVTIAGTLDSTSTAISNATTAVHGLADEFSLTGDTVGKVGNILEAGKEVVDAFGGNIPNHKQNAAVTRSHGIRMRSSDVNEIGKASGEIKDTAEAMDDVNESGQAAISTTSKLLNMIPIIGPLISKVVQKVSDDKAAGKENMFVSVLGKIWERIKEDARSFDYTQIITWIEDVVGNVLKWFQGLDNTQITALITGIGGLILTKAVTGLFQSVTGTISAVTGTVSTVVKGLTESVRSITDAVRDANKIKKRQQLAKVIFAFAALIMSVAAAMWLIATIPDDKLDKAAFIVGVIVVVVGAIAIALGVISTKAASAPDTVGVAAMIAALGLTIILIAAAIKLISEVEIDGKVIGRLVLIGVIIGAFVGVLYLLSKQNWQFGFGAQLFGIALAMLAFAKMISSLVGSMEKLAKADFTGIWKNLIPMIAMVGMMAVLAKALQGVKFSGAFGLTLMIADLWLLIAVMEAMSKVDMTKVAQGIPALIAVMLVMAALLAITRIAGKKAGGAGFAIMGMAVSLLIIGKAIENFTKIPENKMGLALRAVTIIGLIMSILMAASQVASAKAMLASAISFIVIGAALNLFYLAMKQIGGMDEDEYTKGLRAITSILGEFAIILALTEHAKPGKLALFLIEFGAILLIIAGVFYLMRDIKGDNMVRQVSAINNLLLGLIVIIAVVLAIGFIFKNLDPATTVDVIGTGLLILDAVIADLALMATLLGALAVGVGSILEEHSGLEDKLDKGIEFFNKVGAGIGEFFGSISGGFSEKKMEGQGKGIEALGASMDEASAGIEKFSSAVNNLDPSKITIGTSLGEVLQAFSEAGKGYNKKNVEKLSSALTDYTPLILDFYRSMRSTGLKSSLMQQYAESIQSLSSIADIATSDFNADSFSKYVESLGNLIPTLVWLAWTVSNEDFEVDIGKIDKLIKVGKSFSDLQKSLPEFGGTVQKWTGTPEELSTFAEDIKSYVFCIKAVDRVIADFDAHEEKWQPFVEIGKQFSEFYTHLPTFKSTDLSVMASGDLDTFASDIENYVNGLIAVNDVLKSLDKVTGKWGVDDSGRMVLMTETIAYEWSDSWDMLVEVGTTMSELYKVLPGYSDTDAGFWERIAAWLTKNSDAMGTFGQDLSRYIDAIIGVNNYLTEKGITADSIDTEALGLFKTIAEDWASVATSIAETNTTKLASLGLAIGGVDGIGASLAGFYETIKTVQLEYVKTSLSTIKEIVQEMVEISGLQGDVDGAAAISESIKGFGDSMVMAFSDAFASSTVLQGLGFDLASQVAQGMAESSEISDKASEAARKGARAAQGEQPKFVYAGRMLGYGLRDGMAQMNGLLYHAGRQLANSALAGVEDRAAIESPSKEGEADGVYIALGLINGLEKMGRQVRNSGASVSENALNGMNQMLSHVYDMVSGTLEYDPVIRPVLDLSNIKAGSAQLQSMLYGTAPSYIPKVALPSSTSGKSSSQSTASNSITNNFYVQNMDDAHIEYFIQRVNREIGAKV